MDPTRALLSSHIQEKFFNHQTWLGKFLDPSEAKPTDFPYRYNHNVEGELAPNDISPNDQRPLNLDLPPDNKPVYILNIPFVPSLDRAKATEKLSQLTKIIQQQSFGLRAEDSVKEVARRIIVIFGMNRPTSCDASDEQVFFNWVREIPNIEGGQYHIVARMWNASFKLSSAASQQKEKLKKKLKGKFYPVQRAFKILKVLNKEQAVSVKSFFAESSVQRDNLRSQVPFQYIRNWIKTTTLNLPRFEMLLARRITYLGIMDDDAVAFRNEGQGQGLFSEYDTIVHENSTLGPPMLMSTGYFASAQESLTTRLANKIDMAIRNGMAKIIPLSPYFPEPNAMLLLNERKLREKISFFGKGNNTEMRRLLTNLKGIIVSERVFFLSKPCLFTSFTEEMKARTVSKLEISKVGQLEILKSMRGTRQTHLGPLLWANNVYMSLPIKAPCVAKLNKALMPIFSSFDPTNLAQTLANQFGKYHYKYLVFIQQNYVSFSEKLIQASSKKKKELEALAEEWATNAIPDSDENKLDPYIAFFNAHAEILSDALNDLNRVHKLDIDWCNKVLQAARLAGLGIYQTLQAHVSGLT